MLKELIVKYKTKKAIKAPNKKETVSFSSAKSIGLLFDSDENYKKTKPFIEVLTKEGKTVTVLIRSKGKEPPTENHYLHKNFNWIGRNTSDKIEKFINNSFDYLFMLNDECHYLNEYILATSKAKCRVGLNNEKYQHFFELMFDNSKKESIDSFYKTVKGYLDKIKS